MVKKRADLGSYSPQTRLVLAARDYSEHGIIPPPVFHASTYLYPTLEAFYAPNKEYSYGRRGTPTSRALESAIALIERGHAAKVGPSGLAAITSVLLAFLRAGDHLLMTDAVYLPARQFCDTLLKNFGIEITYYDPLVGAGITELIRPNTRMIYCESPGSQTLEIQDIPAIAEVTRRRGVLVAADNTWSGGYYFNAFDHGADLSIQAATKYICGHADVMLGAATCTAAVWPQYKQGFETLGLFTGPDDMYLALRGLRTLDVRLNRHMANGLAVAEWLAGRPEVTEVIYPALPGSRGHELWKRDFTGASGLFSVVLKPARREAISAMLDGLEVFGIGESWGGFESLVIPFKPVRTATTWNPGGPCLRLHIGLENPADLVLDLEAGFRRMNAT